MIQKTKNKIVLKTKNEEKNFLKFVNKKYIKGETKKENKNCNLISIHNFLKRKNKHKRICLKNFENIYKKRSLGIKKVKRKIRKK